MTIEEMQFLKNLQATPTTHFHQPTKATCQIIHTLTHKHSLSQLSLTETLHQKFTFPHSPVLLLLSLPPHPLPTIFMNPSFRLSSTKNTPSFHTNSHPFISKTTPPLFSSKTHTPKREGPHLHVKPCIQSELIQYPSVTTLSIKNTRLCWHPFASLSSFAEAEGEGEQKEQQQQHQHEHAKPKKRKDDDEEEEELPGIAQAFKISPKTASAISICMVLVALVFPFFMTCMGQGVTLKTKLLSYATLLFGLYMAWNIGANDVANAMGTSVGSGALTLKQAVLTAAVLEFSGALLMGSHVTSTMQKGLLVSHAFQGKDSLLFAGLLSSLAAAGTWLQVTVINDLRKKLEALNPCTGLKRKTLRYKNLRELSF